MKPSPINLLRPELVLFFFFIYLFIFYLFISFFFFFLRKSPAATSEKKKGKSARVWANEGKNTTDLDFSGGPTNGEGDVNAAPNDTKSMPTQAEVIEN